MCTRGMGYIFIYICTDMIGPCKRCTVTVQVAHSFGRYRPVRYFGNSYGTDMMAHLTVRYRDSDISYDTVRSVLHRLGLYCIIYQVYYYSIPVGFLFLFLCRHKKYMPGTVVVLEVCFCPESATARIHPGL